MLLARIESFNFARELLFHDVLTEKDLFIVNSNRNQEITYKK
jgi:hypothetical protein